MIDREKVARAICIERNAGDCHLSCNDDTGCLEVGFDEQCAEMMFADAAISAVLEQLREPLEAIAKDCWVPGRSDKEMYRAWRAIAVERVDIARGLLDAAFPPQESKGEG